jgi:hypothetical protein
LRASGEAKIAQKVGNSFVYANPVLADMARVINALIKSGDRAEEVDSAVAVKKMIDLYSWDMPTINAEHTIKADREIVLLTGSTGGLGSQMLASLLTNERVEKVYTLNRPSSKKTPVARHEDTFRDRSDL